ncbi:5,6-dimethylbenzimidazole synthase [Notoacmeibacter ruber]|uniref:5,6-dimethylbenzimidazole synthase n=1 Tax=Notoacmeibacter ruber TaxID=2670375 RepID=A0A3L7JFM0_9HYPH|nr:5,6-dimethylbenzimidazole synthase [Notoacmeibacter ruber]RLQ89119.1 5,6-dimethylbenzimidazole synthase [Notoacmeibacter ruber]
MSHAERKSDSAAPPVFGEDFRAEFETLLAWRRDVRHFTGEALPDGALERLIATTALAPSVGNAQPWRFVCVSSPVLREQLADHVDAASRAAAKAYAPERAAAYRALKLHGLREAPEILAVYSDEKPAAGHGLGIATMPEMLRYSTVMAIHTFWLAARTQGIGVGWVSIVEPQTVNRLLDLPDDWSLIAILCVGYPALQTDRPELAMRGWQDRTVPDIIRR